MAGKSPIQLVNVQKPTANTPVLQRRNKLTANIEQQIVKIGSFREGRRISRQQFWIEPGGIIYFALKYGKQPLEVEKGKSIRKAATFEDLTAQLEEIKIICLAGGLDAALATCASQVRDNFKVAKDKKAAKGA